MAEGLAIVAGRGDLPRLLAEDCARRGRRYRVVVFEGTALDWTGGHPVTPARFERPGQLFADLRAAGCGEVVFAGGIVRPALRLFRFDLTMLRLAPRLIRGIRSGDDRTLRLVAAIFEAEGFVVRAAHEILTDLVPPPGLLGRVAPSAGDRRDAARAAEIVAALGAADVGQGAVVAGGICLGLESIQGTDAMLAFVARTPAPVRPKAPGVLYKAAKPGQDRRLDLPAVGVDTVRAAAAAGLAGIAVEAGGVMVLGCAEAVGAADAAGLFLWVMEPGEHGGHVRPERPATAAFPDRAAADKLGRDSWEREPMRQSPPSRRPWPAMRRVLLAAVLLAACGRLPEVAMPGSGNEGTTELVEDRVWIDVGADAPDGSLRAFLSDGTLVMTSCVESYRLAPWRWVEGTTLVWEEDGRPIRADVAMAAEDEMALVMDLGGETVSRRYRAARAPVVCPDLPS